jgi:hypothetical protein
MIVVAKNLIIGNLHVHRFSRIDKFRARMDANQAKADANMRAGQEQMFSLVSRIEATDKI